MTDHVTSSTRETNLGKWVYIEVNGMKIDSKSFPSGTDEKTITDWTKAAINFQKAQLKEVRNGKR